MAQRLAPDTYLGPVNVNDILVSHRSEMHRVANHSMCPTSQVSRPCQFSPNINRGFTPAVKPHAQKAAISSQGCRCAYINDTKAREPSTTPMLPVTWVPKLGECPCSPHWQRTVCFSLIGLVDGDMNLPAAPKEPPGHGMPAFLPIAGVQTSLSMSNGRGEPFGSIES